jgi:sodium-independent sulfate anion transporter 11
MPVSALATHIWYAVEEVANTISVITGSAITILSGQVSTLLGIPGINTRDPAYHIAINTLKRLGQTKLDAAMGVGALALLYILRYACSFASQRWSSKAKMYFFLSTLRTVFVILLFTLVSFLVNRHHREKPKFVILGHIPTGKLSFPHLEHYLSY